MANCLNSKYNMVCILGPTASGKTGIATQLAYKIDSEIISADSRQVYRQMDLGTGKDIDEYTVNNKNIPYHLINIKDAGEKYNVYQYQNDFFDAFNKIVVKDKMPIMCGGSGMYIESVLKGYNLIHVPKNEERREELEKKNIDELINILKKYKHLHNNSDIETKKRCIRAIEIEEYYTLNPKIKQQFPKLTPLVVGVKIDRETRRKRITERLQQRLDEGMIEEVKLLLSQGINADDLIYYGLEYKYLTLYAIGELSYSEMQNQLNIAIHQFAKRQMTYFRKMEKAGINIHWIDFENDNENICAKILHLL